MTTATPSAGPRRRGRRGRRDTSGLPPVSREAWRRLAACTAAAALLQLDGTLITVALPTVAHGLGVKGSSTSVVLSAYFGAYALVLIPGGELVDRFGVRRLALIGLAVFAVGAAAGALVSSFDALIVARIVQGIGAGLVSPAALAGAVSGFPRERRGSALGIWGASAGMSNLLGPLLGGLLTVAFGWRADWWALVPIAVAVAVAIARVVPAVLESDPDEQAGEPSADGPTVNRVVLGATLVAALTFAVMIGAFYIAEQYLQRAAGFSALGAAGALVLVALLVGAAAPLAGVLVDRRGERLPAVLGFAGAALGLAILGIPGFTLSGIPTVLPLIPVGLGLGMLFVPTSRAALNATPMASHGRTSALLSVGRLLGAAVGAGLAGVALSGTLTASTVHDTLLAGAVLCALVGIPAALMLGPRTARTPRLSAGSASHHARGGTPLPMGVTRQDATPDPRTSPREARGRAKRWPITILAVLAGVLKVQAWRHLIRNAAGLWAIFGFGLFGSILRTRPVGLALSVAGLTAMIVRPALPEAIGLGVGLFAVLLVLFTIVGTVLMARQGRSARRF